MSTKGRRSIFLNVSETEQVTVSIRVLTRVKTRDKLLRALLLLEYWESLPEKFLFLKYYFPEFYTRWEFKMFEDLIHQTKGITKKKYNTRLQYLWKFELLKEGPYTKQDLVTQVAGLEFQIQERPTKGHNTRYGYTKHYKDHGHLPPEKPDYSMDPDELEENFLILQEEENKVKLIRNFLLSEGTTNFAELFPSFRAVNLKLRETL